MFIIMTAMLRYHLYWNCNIILMLLFVKNTDLILIFCSIELSQICVKYKENMGVIKMTELIQHIFIWMGRMNILHNLMREF